MDTDEAVRAWTAEPVTGTPKLNAALAAAQAEMPPIAKGETGKISGTDKYGKPFSYTYSYADLGGLAAVAYPVLGKHGLSFSAQPTLTSDGKFVLRYQLRHASGESLDGVMMLPSAGKPQDLGSVLTYYRRYAFCAVTGIHPGGDDDDAAAANHAQQYDNTPQSAAEAFEKASPAPSRQPANGNGQPANGHAVRPAQAPRPAAAQPGGEPDPDAQPFADEAHQATVTETVKDIHNRARDAHKLAALIRNPATGGVGGLGQYLNHRRSVLQKAEQALAALRSAAGTAGIDDAGIEGLLQDSCGMGIEEASAEEMAKVTETILAETGAAA